MTSAYLSKKLRVACGRTGSLKLGLGSCGWKHTVTELQEWP